MPGLLSGKEGLAKLVEVALNQILGFQPPKLAEQSFHAPDPAVLGLSVQRYSWGAMQIVECIKKGVSMADIF